MLLACLLGAAGCGSSSGAGDSSPTTVGAAGASATASTGAVWQVGTISALSGGAYDGIAPVADVASHGTLGLGTFDGLDGEMVVVDGVVWQVPVDGVPTPAPPDETTPYAQVISFHADRTVTIAQPTSCADLGPAIDAALGTTDQVLALRIEGRFSALQVRSEAAQTLPYRPLSEIIPAEQVVSDLGDVDAVVVGFRTADDLESVSPKGYHLHGITLDHTAGGHVLGCTFTGGDVQVEVATGLDLSFP